MYEATLHVALLNKVRSGNKRTYLTLVGGGAFGNHEQWIIDAVVKNLRQFQAHDLDLRFISYSGPSPVVGQILDQLN